MVICWAQRDEKQIRLRGENLSGIHCNPNKYYTNFRVTDSLASVSYQIVIKFVKDQYLIRGTIALHSAVNMYG